MRSAVEKESDFEGKGLNVPLYCLFFELFLLYEGLVFLFHGFESDFLLLVVVDLKKVVVFYSVDEVQKLLFVDFDFVAFFGLLGEEGLRLHF